MNCKPIKPDKKYPFGYVVVNNVKKPPLLVAWALTDEGWKMSIKYT